MINWCSRSDTDSTLKPTWRLAKAVCKLLAVTPNLYLLIDFFQEMRTG